MRIAFSGSVARKVFGAGKDAFAPHRAIEHPRIRHHFLRITSVAAALERIVGRVVIGDVEHGAEIQIETEEPENLSREFAVRFDELGVSFVTKGLRIRRLFTDEAQAGNTPPFLVNGDEGLDLRDVSEVIDQLSQLLGRLDIPTKKNVAAGLQFFQASGCFRVEFETGDAGEEQLAKVQ